MANRHIIDRKLPERAKLMFYFPKPSIGDDYFIVEMPFFENVRIRESKKARYQKYSLLSRSSNLYSYLGADSRQLNLSFNMTLPHILDDNPGLTLQQFIDYSSSENDLAEKEKFRKPYKANDTVNGMAFKLGTHYTKELAFASAKQVLLNDQITAGMDGISKKVMMSKFGIAEAELGLAIASTIALKEQTTIQINEGLANQDKAEQKAKEDLKGNENMQLQYRIIDLIIYWTNIIRSSVVNNADNPIYGPPTIRLRHGILYQDIPCICTDYSISYNEAAGYDINTLLPRQLNITMNLEEIRTGDFGKFNTTKITQQDNLAGWEAVVNGDTHSMDPGSGGLYLS
tara:strand:+ start:342 stop:1370 length:1029 start_codon:yes stop_codon:yes gene_type:complete